jgi:transketolase C-terminal domain/subunit
MPDQCIKIKRIGIEDKFADQYGSQNSLLENWGISTQHLCAAMRN